MSFDDKFLLISLIYAAATGFFSWIAYRKGRSEERYFQTYCSDCADDIEHDGLCQAMQSCTNCGHPLPCNCDNFNWGAAQPAAGTTPTVIGHEEFEQTDTQQGMSSEALGQQFPAYFQPAPSEGTTPQAERPTSQCLVIEHMHTPEKGCWEYRPLAERIAEARTVAPVERPEKENND